MAVAGSASELGLDTALYSNVSNGGSIGLGLPLRIDALH
jgi:hypothetical protein